MPIKFAVKIMECACNVQSTLKHLLAVFVQISGDASKQIRGSMTYVMRLEVPAGHVAMVSVVDLKLGDIGSTEDPGAFVTVYAGSDATTTIRSEHGNVYLGGTYTSPSVYPADTDEVYVYFKLNQW